MRMQNYYEMIYSLAPEHDLCYVKCVDLEDAVALFKEQPVDTKVYSLFKVELVHTNVTIEFNDYIRFAKILPKPKNLTIGN